MALKIEVERIMIYDHGLDPEGPVVVATVEICDEYTCEIAVKSIPHNAASWRALADDIAAAIQKIHPEHQP